MSNNKRKATPSMYEDENIIHELVSYTRDQAANKEGTLLKATPSIAVGKITKKKQEFVQEVIEIKSDEDEEQTALITMVSKEKLSREERIKSEINLTSDSDSDESENESESGLSGYKEYWCCKCEKGLDEVEALVNFDNKELYCANCINSNTEQRDTDLKWARFANK